MGRLQLRRTELQPGEYPLEGEPIWDHKERRIGFWNFQENTINWFRIPRKGDSESYIPNHEWNGSWLHWQLPDGSWGPWVDLRGLGISEITSTDNLDGTFTIDFTVGEDTFSITSPDLTGEQGPPGSAPLVNFELNDSGELVIDISYDDDANPATATIDEEGNLIIEYTGFSGSRIIANVGRIVPIYKEVWDVTHKYDAFDAVLFQGSTYYVGFGKDPPIGTLPTNDAYWVLWAAKGDFGGNYLAGVVNQTAASYSLAISDQGKLIACDYATDNTVTVTKQSTALWPDEPVVIHIAQTGNGPTNIVPDAGVTIVSLFNFTRLGGKGAAASLTRISEDNWLLSGALA